MLLSTKKKHLHIDKEKYDFEIALAGNPNVGKSTIFNTLTALNQHTGNWTGKTVENATGFYKHDNYAFKTVDLPGVYSLNPLSQEESIAHNYLINADYSAVVVVIDATNLERNLNLALQILSLTTKVIICLNLCDQAKKKGIHIDTDELSLQLGVPVIATSATKKIGINTLKDTILKLCNNEIKTFKIKLIADCNDNNYEKMSKEIFDICSRICDKCVDNKKHKNKDIDTKLDTILTSKATGIPIMLLLLCVIFWITIVGANYISDYLSLFFNYIKFEIYELLNIINVNDIITSFLIDGIYTTLTWIVAVMLPPMAIFFPIFSLLEDSGYLPRIAFNLDGVFSKAGAHSKQALTMAMGFGCSCCGVMGCRIIDSDREKNIAILTNSFIPCNGKLPTLIAITSIFITNTASAFLGSFLTSIVLLLLILVSVFITLLISKFLTNTFLKGQPSSFILELPPYRKPQFIKTIIYSLKDRTLFILLRAISVAIPAGAVIWLMANIYINENSIFNYCVNFLEPLGQLLGLDGVIVMAFILGFPANETVIPIILMGYSSNSMLTDFASISQLSDILISNGWTIVTAVCFIVMCMFHYPCSTTCITIYKETKSIKLTALSIIIPTLIGVLLCFLINLFHTVF